MAHKIMIVDDDSEFREEFREFLKEYDVVEAADGDEAIAILRKPNDIGLVILDVNMPRIKGTEALRTMKEIAPEVRVVILTAHSSEDVVIEALRGHADEYLQKPIDVFETKSVIERLMSTEPGADGDCHDKVEKAKEFVERNCFRKTSLADAARAVFLSPKYLSRIFKETTGTGFGEYRLHVQMARAKKLLGSKSYNVNEVAYKLGYKNPESFIRQFKKMSGITPTEFRRRKRRK